MLAGFLGFSGIALGAMASHVGAFAKSAEDLKIAGFYALVHAPVLLIIACKMGRSAMQRPLWLAGWTLAAGVILFSGSLFLKAASDFHPILAPYGGSLMMSGWLLVAFSGLRGRI